MGVPSRACTAGESSARCTATLYASDDLIMEVTPTNTAATNPPTMASSRITIDGTNHFQLRSNQFFCSADCGGSGGKFSGGAPGAGGGNVDIRLTSSFARVIHHAAGVGNGDCAAAASSGRMSFVRVYAMRKPKRSIFRCDALPGCAM